MPNLREKDKAWAYQAPREGLREKVVESQEIPYTHLPLLPDGVQEERKSQAAPEAECLWSA